MNLGFFFLIRSQNTRQLNITLCVIKQYSSAKGQEKIAPKRIHRGPTDILKVRSKYVTILAFIPKSIIFKLEICP